MNEYLNEEVNYGGETMTRGAMLADLQRLATTLTDDPVRQQLIVNRYMQGFERAN